MGQRTWREHRYSFSNCAKRIIKKKLFKKCDKTHLDWQLVLVIAVSSLTFSRITRRINTFFIDTCRCRRDCRLFSIYTYLLIRWIIHLIFFFFRRSENETNKIKKCEGKKNSLSRKHFPQFNGNTEQVWDKGQSFGWQAGLVEYRV